jgi:hypothetical protein
VWRTKQERATEVQLLKAQRVAELQQRSDRLEEAFIYEKTIDHAVYIKHKDRVQEELTIAELELHDARIDALDVEGVLEFAEHLIANVGRIWVEAALDQRQRIQAAIFPEGIPFDGHTFGTAATCIAFNRNANRRTQKTVWRPHGDPVTCIRCAAPPKRRESRAG